MSAVPLHVYRKWRHFNRLIDGALAAALRPWALAEIAACAIAGEWVP